ncbi:hypothetical protein PCANC_19605 [Puccinia coronata f. sp. avenae]|uniref:Uncharacterized protein n=1 Tax=Puccinia coronata f. sp. avenae TaxID=200324 RepID=A0A2N5SP47_9BASI|nr:hypothetical protein PCANC_19605 [Puccinia coronata f. sp. avenae]
MARPNQPPVSTPFADSGQILTYRPIGFGAYASKPKCFIPLPIAYAPLIPIMTSSSKHSYRLTRQGIELIAIEGKELLGCRISISEMRQSSR